MYLGETDLNISIQQSKESTCATDLSYWQIYCLLLMLSLMFSTYLKDLFLSQFLKTEIYLYHRIIFSAFSTVFNGTLYIPLLC